MQTQSQNTQNSFVPPSTSQENNANVRQAFSMSLRAQELAEECITRKSLLISLSRNKCFSDAIMLLSYAMPEKKGLQWVINCFKLFELDKNNDSDAMEAAQSWLNNPNQINRANVMPKQTVFKPTAITWLSMATYWAGGGINDTSIYEPAPVGLVNDSLYSALMLSIQEQNVFDNDQAFNQAIEKGIELLYSEM